MKNICDEDIRAAADSGIGCGPLQCSVTEWHVHDAKVGKTKNKKKNVKLCQQQVQTTILRIQS